MLIRTLPHSESTTNDLNGDIILSLLCVCASYVHPVFPRGLLVLEQIAELGGIIGQRIRVDFHDSSLFIFLVFPLRNGDVDAGGDVGETRTAERVGAVRGAVHGARRGGRGHGGGELCGVARFGIG